MAKSNGKQVRIGNGAHAALSQLADKHGQPIGTTVSQAIALYKTVVERMERRAGGRIYIETDGEPRQEVLLPLLLDPEVESEAEKRR